MTAPRRHGTDPVGGGGSAALRGALLIGLAVALGVILLGQSFDDGIVAPNGDAAADDPGDDGADDDGGEGSVSDETTPDQTTTSTVPARSPADVRVYALNGFGGSGVAGAATTQLGAAMYVTVPADNVPGDQQVQASAVYFTPGFDADAVAVATVLGLAATVPTPLPTPLPPQVPGGDVKGANVVVVLGPDYAPG